MIKANLAVLNGESAEEVKEKCKLRSDSIFGLVHEVSKNQEKHLENLKKDWDDNWDSILNDQVDYEEYQYGYEMAIEREHEEEKQFQELEKMENEAQILFYIKGFFSSVIFFITLWHLLNGLYFF